MTRGIRSEDHTMKPELILTLTALLLAPLAAPHAAN